MSPSRWISVVGGRPAELLTEPGAQVAQPPADPLADHRAGVPEGGQMV
jgi:hypothetical protein